ncbi:MAG: acyl-ACP--UDP-N-acetylglucosamine O-acyltransferase [Steroidobacteraceae bacterium]
MIDPRALVDPKAALAADVEVGPFAVIGANVSVGARTKIGPHVVIHGPTSVGADCHIFQFASLGDEPQDKKYNGEPTRLEIGDRNQIREFTTMHRGTVQGHGVTRVGSDGLFMAYTHVAHDCIVGNRVVLANYATLAGHVEIGDWVIMGGYSGIHQFCKVGAHCFLANNAAVTRDVPPFLLVTGSPACAHSINSEGLKRRGFTAPQILNIRRAYKILFRSDLKLEAATVKLRELASGAPEVQPFVDFIPTITRSLIR